MSDSRPSNSGMEAMATFLRLRTPQCPGCAYQLGGTASPTCPECGRTFGWADAKVFSRWPLRVAIIAAVINALGIATYLARPWTDPLDGLACAALLVISMCVWTAWLGIYVTWGRRPKSPAAAWVIAVVPAAWALLTLIGQLG